MTNRSDIVNSNRRFQVSRWQPLTSLINVAETRRACVVWSWRHKTLPGRTTGAVWRHWPGTGRGCSPLIQANKLFEQSLNFFWTPQNGRYKFRTLVWQHICMFNNKHILTIKGLHTLNTYRQVFLHLCSVQTSKQPVSFFAAYIFTAGIVCQHLLINKKVWKLKDAKKLRIYLKIKKR